jgi:superkiller protein 3
MSRLIIRHFLGPIILLITLNTIGNTVLYGVSAEDLSSSTPSDELMDMLINSANSLNSYSFTMNATQNISIANQTMNITKTANFEIGSSNDGAVNLTAQSIRLSNIGSMNIDGNKSVTSPESKTYFINETIYMGLDKNWTLIKLQNTSQPWGQDHMAQHQVELLNRSTMKISELEKIDGQDCYRVEIIPNIESYTELVSEQMGTSLPLKYLNFTDLYKNSSIEWTSWVLKDSVILKKSDIGIKFTLTPEMLEIPVQEAGGWEINVSFNATMLFRDFNHPVEITLPEGAKNATEIQVEQSSDGSGEAPDNTEAEDLSAANENCSPAASAVACACTKDLEIKDESNPSDWYKKGKALCDLGRYNESIEAYNKAIELDQSYGDAWRDEGLAFAVLQRYQESIACFEKAIELNQKDAKAWNGKANLLYDLERYNDSLECFDWAVGLDPRYKEALNSKGSALCDLGRYNESIGCFDKAIEIDPEFSEAWYNKGSALYDLGRYNESIECFDKAIEMSPRYSEAWYNKGVALYKLGRCNESIESFDMAIEINPQDAIAWSNKGGALDDLGKYNESIKAYDNALEIDSSLVGAWYNKGNALYHLGRYNESITSYDRAIDLDPTFAWAWNDKGKALKALGQDKEAEAAISKARELGYS